MPRLVSFVVCDRMIVDKDDNSLTLIGVINGITLASDEVVQNTMALADVQWAAATTWQILDEDKGKVYEQRIQIVLPDGEPVGASIIAYKSIATFQNANVRGDKFPVKGTGLHHMRLSLRDVESGEDWVTINDYPIAIRIGVEANAPSNEDA